MSVTLNPYLHFNGNAEEVAHFYAKVFGVEPTINRYGDDAAARIAPAKRMAARLSGTTR